MVYIACMHAFYLLDCCHLVAKNYAIPPPPSFSMMKLELRCLQCNHLEMQRSPCALLHRLFCKLNILKFPQLRYGVQLYIHCMYMYMNRPHVNRLYAELYNMFIIFHAWYQNTFVHAWRGMFQRDNFLRSCEVSFCSGCDRRNSFEREIIIGNNVSD